MKKKKHGAPKVKNGAASLLVTGRDDAQQQTYYLVVSSRRKKKHGNHLYHLAPYSTGQTCLFWGYEGTPGDVFVQTGREESETAPTAPRTRG